MPVKHVLHLSSFEKKKKNTQQNKTKQKGALKNDIERALVLFIILPEANVYR